MKTPLAALDLLLQVEPVNVLAAREEVRKIDRYVQMMLTYVRLNDVNSDLALTAVDLNVLVRSVVRELAQLFIGKDLRVQVDDLPTVTSDARWLRFICEQLLTNAAKYTERGGVHVSFTDGALIIADTGIGILPQDLPRLFDRGFSGFNGHANQKATGLGLYMSQTIAKKLGSSLTVTSAVGTGTTVKLSFDQTAWTPE